MIRELMKRPVAPGVLESEVSRLDGLDDPTGGAEAAVEAVGERAGRQPLGALVADTDQLRDRAWIPAMDSARRGDDGRFLWPGFGENSRVLKWVAERVAGRADAVETPIGYLPAPGALDLEGLEVPAADVAEALSVDADGWREEIPRIAEWFERFGPKLPGVLWAELEALKARLAE